MLFKFVGLYSEKDKKLFKSTQEKDLRKISSYLKTPRRSVRNIKFEVFDTRKDKQKADPHNSISRASARFKEMTVYRYWEPNNDPHFPHEITHLVAHTWVKPYRWQVELDTWDGKLIHKTIDMVSTSFMQEGLAIAVDEIVFNRKLLENGEKKYPDEWCRKFINKIPQLRACVNFDGFNSFNNEVVVPFSASLSKYLIKKYGLNKFKNMYVLIRETAFPNKNIKTIENIYGVKSKDLLNNWRTHISLK